MLADPLYWGLVLLGIVANFGLALREASQNAGVRVWPRQYVRDNPYAALLGTLGGVAAGFWIAGDVEAVRMGFVAGLAGTAFLERLNKRKVGG